MKTDKIKSRPREMKIFVGLGIINPEELQQGLNTDTKYSLGKAPRELGVKVRDIETREMQSLASKQ